MNIEDLKSSAMVRIPVTTGALHNTYGKYWASISNFIMGLHDLRPRHGTFTNPWGASSNPIFAAPVLRANNDSLSDMMDRRACELLDISARENRPLAVLWSGGIDSTGVLSSLIKNSTNNEQIHVYCSQKSIVENPFFYKNHIVGKLKCFHVRQLDCNEDFIDANILLHGDPGDCLFGPSMAMYAKLMPAGDHLRPWRDQRPAIIDGIESLRSIPGFAKWYVDKISDNIDEVNLYNIDTVSDWWWWHYFNLKWEFSNLRPFFDSRKNPYTTVSTHHLKKYADTTFFNTAEFQSWSYTNLPRLCLDKKGHKADLKQYIFELDKNEFYKNNKVKTVSNFGIIDNRPAVLTKDLYSYFDSDPGVTELLVSCLEDYRG